MKFWAEKTAAISRRYHWFPREMASEQRVQKFPTDEASVPRHLGSAYDWLKRGTTNQRQNPDLGSDSSSVWNFCACFSDVITLETQLWRREMSAVFSS